jgi:hypothetical protein
VDVERPSPSTTDFKKTGDRHSFILEAVRLPLVEVAG